MNLAGISDALRPIAGQRLDALIILDTGSSMEIWQPAVAGLHEILARQEGFRTVRTRQMNCATASIESGGGPVGRPVVFVVTDTIASGWRSGAVCRLLSKWAGAMPVAIINVLPQRLWAWGGLSPSQIRLTAANQRQYVPVLGLGAEWWSGWAGLLAYGRPTLTTGVPAQPDARIMAEPDEPLVGLPARRRLLQFRTFASVEAFQLAGLLAAVPLNIPVMQQVQQVMLPKADVSIVAEVLLGRVLRRVATGEVTLDFLDGVRQELLALQRRADTVRVVRVLGEEPSSAQSRNFRAAVDDPLTAPLLEPVAVNLPYLQVQATTFRALSGRYANRAARLREAIQIASSGGERVTGPPASAQSARAPASRPQIWGAVPLRNPDFVGRDGLLEQLRKRLIEPGATAVLPEALHGMGGVGKSQTVVEYIYRHAAEYDVVWWIPAEHGSLITSSFVELARRFDLPSGSAEVAIPAVLDALRRGEPPISRWLLVFDNADRPDVVSPFFPASGHIVVTSRNSEWAGVARTVEVDVFARSESIELLRRRSGDISETDADHLAEALGDLPLAIEQAAAWRALTGMPVDEILRLLDEHLPELLGAEPPDEFGPAGYRPSVVALWNVSLNRLRKDHPAALELLQVCAFFGPEPISRNLFTGIRDAAPMPAALAEVLHDPIKLNRAIRELSRYSLAKIDHRANTIQIHRLVQTVVKSKLTSTEQTDMSHAVHVLLAYGYPGDPVSPQMWPRYAELLPHVTNSNAANCSRPDSSIRQLLINLVRYLNNRGDFGSAQELARTTLDLWRKSLGSTHADTLVMARRCAVSLRRLGRLREAQALNDETYELVRETFGEDSELALDIADTRTADMRSQGLFSKELDMQQDLFERARRVLGEDDPDTLKYANNLASCLRLNGKFEQARERDEETLRRKVVVLGDDHPSTFQSLNALAMDLRECGHWLRACQVQEDTLRRQREVVGDDHLRTIGAMRNLAVARRMAGQHEGARELSDLCVQRYRRRQGDRHVDTITAEMSLSADLRRLDELAESEKIASQSHELFIVTHGRTHPYTLISANNLAITLRLMGAVHDAQTLDADTLTHLRRIFGDDHPFTLVSATNMASDLATLGDFESAQEMDADTFQRSSRVLGPGHPSTLAVAFNLSYDLAHLGLGDEAAILHSKTLMSLRAALGDDHPAILAAVRSIRANCDTDTMQL
jgi:tetratricopeptide (TPR) repeat protein